MGAKRPPLRREAELARKIFGRRRERAERLPALQEHHHHPRLPETRPARQPSRSKLDWLCQGRKQDGSALERFEPFAFGFGEEP